MKVFEINGSTLTLALFTDVTNSKYSLSLSLVFFWFLEMKIWSTETSGRVVNPCKIIWAQYFDLFVSLQTFAFGMHANCLRKCLNSVRQRIGGDHVVRRLIVVFLTSRDLFYWIKLLVSDKCGIVFLQFLKWQRYCFNLVIEQ